MANILAIEAASDYCSIALDTGSETLQEVLPAARSHSKLLYPMLNRLVDQAGIRPNQLDAISFGKGPGSFTGLRIAAATAQGIGFANDIPLLPVSTLQAMAQQAFAQTHAQNTITLLDARMQEFYGGHYAEEMGIMTPTRNDFIAPLHAKPEQLQIAGADCICYSGDILEHMEPEWQAMTLHSKLNLVLEAQYLLPKAKAMFLNNEGLQANEIELVYLREQDHWKTIKQQKVLKQ